MQIHAHTHTKTKQKSAIHCSLWMCHTTYPAFSSSSSLEPEAVLVGRSSSGRILEPLRVLPSSCVSARRFVWAMFSMMLPPAVISERCGFRAARCFFARVRNAWNRAIKQSNKNADPNTVEDCPSLFLLRIVQIWAFGEAILKTKKTLLGEA